MSSEYCIIFPMNAHAGYRSDIVVINPLLGNGIAIPWDIVNNDSVASNYVLNSDLQSLTYSPIEIITINPPNPIQFVTDIMGDSNISNLAKVNLASYLSVINNYNSQTAIGIKSIWQGLIQEFGSTWLTSTIQQLIIQYALDNNMPLV